MADNRPPAHDRLLARQRSSAPDHPRSPLGPAARRTCPAPVASVAAATPEVV